MDFKTKYMARSISLNALGWTFSLTALILVYTWIRIGKFEDFADWIYPNANLKKFNDLQFVVSDYKSNVIYPLLYWLPVTFMVDYGIRKLLQRNSNINSN